VTIQFSDSFFLSINEYSYDEERNLTTDAIQYIYKLFADYSTQKQDLYANKSICIEQNSIAIERNRYGSSDISGYVHLNRKNLCSIMIIDAQSGDVYYNQVSDGHSQFFVGWSDEQEESFYFFQNLTIKRKSGAPESADVVIQLWVEDSEGSRCVLETQTHFTFWVR
jgi:hypothetical protein